MTRRLARPRSSRVTARHRSVARLCAQDALLWPYLDGELPPARARAVLGHLQACADCTARAQRLRAMLEACRVAGCQQLPPAVRARARSRVRALLAAGGKKS